MRLRQAGIGHFMILAAVVVVAGIGVVGWRVYQHSSPSQKTKTDGSSVSPGAQTTNFKRIVAVGDMVCDFDDRLAAATDSTKCQDEKVAQLVAQIKPDAVLLLGDLQYLDGTLEKFKANFDKHWGQFKPILYPAPGNHEYATPHAAGYYEYFKDLPIDVSKGYYSFTIGSWRIVSLDSNCINIGGCALGSPQLKWLTGELQADTGVCNLAYWHHPRYMSGEYFGNAESKGRSDTFWPLLVAHKTDVVLNGHDHLYERFTPKTGDDSSSPVGIRQFVVGTGGKSLHRHEGLAEGSEKIIDTDYGVLEMDLHDTWYSWKFKNVDAQVLDSGYQKCL